MIKYKHSLLFIFLLLFFLCSCENNMGSTFSNINEHKEDYLITFSKKENIEYLVEKYKLKVVRVYRYFPVVLVSLTAKQIKSLKQEKTIIAIEKDGEVESTENQQKGINRLSQINLIENTNRKYTGKGVNIAILDSGIDSSHKDLKIKGGVSFIGSKNDYNDSTGHGTHVAGIIGAKIKEGRINGIAPQANIYAVKLLNNHNSGKNSNLLSAVEWCLEKKMNIIHMSISSNKKSKAVEVSLQIAYKKGVLMIASAGNQGFYLTESITYPGAYSTVIAVGSVNKNNERSLFSSVGSELEIMAPGESIYSTEPHNKYGYRDGTSMAAPHVTGIIALLIEKYPRLKNDEIRTLIRENSTKLGEPFLYGNGLINADKLLNADLQLKSR